MAFALSPPLALAGTSPSPGGTDLEAALSAARDRGVEGALLESLVQRAEQQGISAAVTVAWIDRVRSLAENRLPVHPVVSRYLQGLAKGIPPQRIDVVVDRLETRLEEAARHIDARYPMPQDASGRRARLTAIDHGAYVLGLGVSQDHLDRSLTLVSADAPSVRDVQAPILTLGILVASGIAPDKSLEVVDTAWESGYRGENLERLGKALGRRGHEGEPPSIEVVDQVLRLIGSDLTQDEVFQGLDELTGREDYWLPGLGPGDDPTIRRGDTDRDLDPPSSPDQRDDHQFRPIERGPE
jgi:hypothetical protein